MTGSASGVLASDLELARVVERNQIDWVIAQGGLPSVELREDDDAISIRGRDRYGPHHICRVRLDADDEAVAAARLESLLAPFRARRFPVSVWVGPSSLPVSLEPLLRARGLRCMRRPPAMALERLDARSRSTPPDPGPGPANLRVEHGGTLDCFDGRTHPGLGRVSSARERELLASARRLAERSSNPVEYAIAWREDEPVGVGTLFVADGVAGLYDIAVLGHHRGVGIGTVITRALLSRASDLGASRAVLLATGKGEGIYLREGFRRVGVFAQWYYSMSQQRRED